MRRRRARMPMRRLATGLLPSSAEPFCLICLLILLNCTSCNLFVTRTSGQGEEEGNMTESDTCFTWCQCALVATPTDTISLYITCDGYSLEDATSEDAGAESGGLLDAGDPLLEDYSSITDGDLDQLDPILVGYAYNISEVIVHSGDVNNVQHSESHSLTPTDLCIVSDLVSLAWLDGQLTPPDVEQFKCFSNLTKLDLSSNHLHQITNLTFHGFGSLQHVVLSHNAISDVNMASFSSAASSLHSLDLSYNALHAFQLATPTTFTSLSQLNLSSNSIRTVRAAFDVVPTLHLLDVSYNQLRDVTFLHSDHAANHLHHLNLSHNQISAFTSGEFSALMELRNLDLSYNRISRMPAELFPTPLQTLVYLDLSNNHIHRVDLAAFMALPGLLYLNLSRNVLDSLAVDMFSLGLEQDSQPALSENDIIVPTPPSNATTLPMLDVLDISYNNVSTLTRHAFSGTLSHARSINLAANGIRHLPRYGIERLEYLESIDLRHNHLDWLDVGTFKNAQLRYINLSHNRIKKLISMAFLYLPRVQIIDLSYNRLKYLYKYIFYRTCGPEDHLHTHIDLQHNRLQSDVIWKIISTFRSIEETECTVHVDLRYNRVSDLLGEANEAYQRHLAFSEFTYFTTWDHVSFDISCNPLHCDCNLYDNARTLIDIRNTFNNNFTHPGNLYFWHNLTCAQPKIFGNMPIIETLPLIKCDVNDACPPSCQCYYVPIKERYVVDCISRDLYVFPSVLPLGHKELYLRSNHIGTLAGTQITLTDVLYLDLSYNKITYIEPDIWGQLLRVPVVLLHANDLPNLPVSSSVELVNESIALINLTLSENPFVCTCETLRLKHWLLNHSTLIDDLAEIRCSNLTLEGRPLASATEADLCAPGGGLVNGSLTSSPSPSQPFVTLSICLSLLAPIMFICFTAAVLFYKCRHRIKVHTVRRWEPRHLLDDENVGVGVPTADILMCFPRKSSRWVRTQLLPELTKRGRPYTVHLQQESFKNGSLLNDYYLENSDNYQTVIFILPKSTEDDDPVDLFKTIFQSSRAARTFIISLDTSVINLNAVENSDLLRGGSFFNANDADFWERFYAALPVPTVKRSRSSQKYNQLAENSPVHFKKY